MKFNLSEACGDTLKEKMQELITFCRNNGMEFPFRCGKEVYYYLECFEHPLEYMPHYTLDSELDDHIIMDVNGSSCHCELPLRI